MARAKHATEQWPPAIIIEQVEQSRLYRVDAGDGQGGGAEELGEMGTPGRIGGGCTEPCKMVSGARLRRRPVPRRHCPQHRFDTSLRVILRGGGRLRLGRGHDVGL